MLVLLSFMEQTLDKNINGTVNDQKSWVYICDDDYTRRIIYPFMPYSTSSCDSWQLTHGWSWSWTRVCGSRRFSWGWCWSWWRLTCCVCTCWVLVTKSHLDLFCSKTYTCIGRPQTFSAGGCGWGPHKRKPSCDYWVNSSRPVRSLPSSLHWLSPLWGGL